MKKYILPILTALLSLPFIGTAQFGSSNCVPVSPLQAIVCPGDSVLIQYNTPSSQNGQEFNFNFGTLPTGWSTTGTSIYSQPCLPGIDNTDYYWAASAGNTTPQINSPGFNLVCGGTIDFDMVFAVQGGSAPCEGPDLEQEGVELQYSTDGGATWTTIIYYSPGGFTLPAMPTTNGSIASGTTPYTSWNSFSVPLPPGALTVNTQIRWIQQNSSGTCCDNWGVDNIVINTAACGGVVVDWTQGTATDDTTSFYYTPSQDTFFVATIYDSTQFANGILDTLCITDTVFITVYQNTMTYDLVDTVYSYCPFDSIPESVLNVQNAPGPFSYDWTTGDTTANTILGGGPNKQDEIWFYVDVTDGCGFVRTDSVVMVVNQTLSIDTVFAQNATACDPDGYASALISGTTTTSGQPFYNWTGPGNPGPNSVDGTVITDVPSGWYYFTVVDDVCEATDSVFIGIDEPPVAAFTPANASGCSPVEVSFVNESENTSVYTWNFGDGSATVSSTDATHSFTQSSTVTLIAADASGCADTAFAVINVVPCGCTDPAAINYNPFALQDDGSCVYPIPVIQAPNVFTPDGDNINDLFFLDSEFTEEITLVITNRWGNVMYEGTGPNPAWDGTSQSGEEAAQGIYFYKYTAVGVLPDSEIEGHGFVHLERVK